MFKLKELTIRFSYNTYSFENIKFGRNNNIFTLSKYRWNKRLNYY